MKALYALLALACLGALMFVGVVAKPDESTPPPQVDAPTRLLVGYRVDARFNESWDHDEVRAALERAGFAIVNDTEFTLRGQREGEPVAVVLPMGHGVVFHVMHEMDPAVAYAPGTEGEAEAERQWREAEAVAMRMLADYEAAAGWTRESVEARPLVAE